MPDKRLSNLTEYLRGSFEIKRYEVLASRMAENLFEKTLLGLIRDTIANSKNGNLNPFVFDSGITSKIQSLQWWKFIYACKLTDEFWVPNNEHYKIKIHKQFQFDNKLIPLVFQKCYEKEIVAVYNSFIETKKRKMEFNVKDNTNEPPNKKNEI